MQTSSQAGKKVAHALQPAIQFLHRGRIRDANVLAGAETLPRNRCHVRFFQQLAANCEAEFTPLRPKKAEMFGKA